METVSGKYVQESLGELHLVPTYMSTHWLYASSSTATPSTFSQCLRYATQMLIYTLHLAGHFKHASTPIHPPEALSNCCGWTWLDTVDLPEYITRPRGEAWLSLPLILSTTYFVYLFLITYSPPIVFYSSACSINTHTEFLPLVNPYFLIVRFLHQLIHSFDCITLLHQRNCIP